MDCSHTGASCPTHGTFAAYLSRREGLDALVVDSVEHHLAGCEICRGVLAVLVRSRGAAGDDDAEQMRSTRPSREDAPVRLGRYIVESRLGAGAMGVVYSAYDPELDRRIAVKVLHHGGPDSGRQDRLVREARALARVRHRNVVAIHDVGVAQGRVWLAMELVPGQTLSSWLRAERRSWAVAFPLLRQAARGLRAIHEAGLLHRDFKPANLMVESTTEGPQARIMDFGLVRMDEASANRPIPPAPTEDLAQTASDVWVGTPAYMAPEQLAGERATELSDQFSFCVTAWEIVVGQRPFRGRTVAELQAAMKRRPVGGEGVPRWLRSLLERGLSLRPELRFASMDALAVELERARTRARRRRGGVAALSVSVGLASFLGLQGLLERRRSAACEQAGEQLLGELSVERLHDIRAALVSAAPSYGSTVADKLEARLRTYAGSWGEVRTEACLDRTVRRTSSAAIDARAQWCLEERSIAFLALLEQLQDADQATASRAIAAAVSLPAPTICREPAYLASAPNPPHEGPELAGIRAEIGRLRAMYETGRQHDEGLAEARALRERAALLGSELVAASAEFMQGMFAGEVGEWAEAEGAMVDAYERAARARDWELATGAARWLAIEFGKRAAFGEARLWARNASVAASLAGDPIGLHAAEDAEAQGIIERRAGDYGTANELLTRAVEAHEGVFGWEHPSTAACLHNLGLVRDRSGDVKGSLDIARRVLEIAQTTLGPEHPKTALALSRVAVMESANGQHVAAMPSYERALAIYEAAYGPQHPSIAVVLSNMAWSRSEVGDYDAAARLLHRSLTIDEAELGPDHPDVGSGLGNLAALHRTIGNPRDALEYAERALSIQEVALGADHPKLVATLTTLGTCHDDLGDSEEAKRVYERGLAIAESSFGDSEHTALLLDNLADVLRRDERFERATALAQRGLEMCQRVFDEGHPDVARAWTTVGLIHLDRGRASQAIDALETAVSTYAAVPGMQTKEPHARFALAMALWDSGVDRRRAIDEARAARDELASSGSRVPEELTAWLAAREPSRPRTHAG